MSPKTLKKQGQTKLRIHKHKELIKIKEGTNEREQNEQYKKIKETIIFIPTC